MTGKKNRSEIIDRSTEVGINHESLKGSGSSISERQGNHPIPPPPRGSAPPPRGPRDAASTKGEKVPKATTRHANSTGAGGRAGMGGVRRRRHARQRPYGAGRGAGAPRRSSKRFFKTGKPNVTPQTWAGGGCSEGLPPRVASWRGPAAPQGARFPTSPRRKNRRCPPTPKH